LKTGLKILFILICLAAFSITLRAQNPVVDSLKLVLKKIKHDTVRCKVLYQLSEACTTKEWTDFNNEMLKICEAHLKDLKPGDNEYVVYRKFYAKGIANLGFEASEKSDGLKAIKLYEESMKIFEELNDKKGIASSLNNIGIIYQSLGNIKQALDNYTKSLKLLESLNDKYGISYCLNNLGYIYHGQGDYEKGLMYYEKAYTMYKEINELPGLAIALVNIGAIYDDRKDYVPALEKYNEALKLYEKMGNKHGMATCINNIGTVNDDLKKNQEALECYLKCLKLYEEVGDKFGIAHSLNNIGLSYFKNKKTDQALEYHLKSMQISKEIGYPLTIKNAARELYKIYKTKGDYNLAIENYKLHIKMRDSISNEENRKATYSQQLKYEYDKKAATDSVAHAKEKLIQSAELKKQEAELSMRKNRQYALFGGLGLVIVFAGVMFNRFKITQKQKMIIEDQKTEVEAQKNIVDEKQKQLLDSINYAKSIQKANLPTPSYLIKTFSRLKSVI